MEIDRDFLNETMMGPNAWLAAEELTAGMPLRPGMRVLDLGCGRGLSSVFLARRFGAEVFAVDLWTPATENRERFLRAGVESLTVPLRLDACRMPFAEGFFDALVSVDAYHYFGRDLGFFGSVLRPLLKPGAPVAVAVPGMKREIGGDVPEEMRPYWDAEALEAWHSAAWWQPRFEPFLDNFRIGELACFGRAWADWLACDNPYAAEDRPMMAADAGRYMNLIGISGTVR